MPEPFKPSPWAYEPQSIRRARAVSAARALQDQTSGLVAQGDPISLAAARQLARNAQRTPAQNTAASAARKQQIAASMRSAATSPPAEAEAADSGILGGLADTFREVVPQGVRDVLGGTLRALTSAEEFGNFLHQAATNPPSANLDEIAPGTWGTQLGEKLYDVPKVGGALRTAFDVALAPATIATAGIGGPVAGALRASSIPGRGILAGLAEVGVGGGFKTKVAAQVAAALGGQAAGRAAHEAATAAGAPEWGVTAAELAGNLAGGVAGVGAVAGARRIPSGVRAMHQQSVREALERAAPEIIQQERGGITRTGEIRPASIRPEDAIPRRTLIAPTGRQAGGVAGGALRDVTEQGYSDAAPLYRGDATQIRDFSLAKADPDALFGRGIYLTDKPEVARTYTTKNQAGFSSFAMDARTPAQAYSEVIERHAERLLFEDGYAAQQAGGPRVPGPREARAALTPEQWNQYMERARVAVPPRANLDIVRQGSIFRVSEKSPEQTITTVPTSRAMLASMIDGERAIPDDVAGAIEAAAREVFVDAPLERATAEAILSKFDREGVFSLSNSRSSMTFSGSPGRRPRFAEAWQHLMSLPRTPAEKDALQTALRRRFTALGYNGIRYDGGLRMPAAAGARRLKHNAYVLWDEQGLNKLIQGKPLGRRSPRGGSAESEGMLPPQPKPRTKREIEAGERRITELQAKRARGEAGGADTAVPMPGKTPQERLRALFAANPDADQYDIRAQLINEEMPREVRYGGVGWEQQLRSNDVLDKVFGENVIFDDLKRRFGGNAPPAARTGGSYVDGAKAQREAVRTFGLTSDRRNAGYILNDGRLLDLGGGGGPGMRGLDHRSVAQLPALEGVPVEAGSSTGYMLAFQEATGAIRHIDEAPGVSIVGDSITAKQASVLRGLIAQATREGRTFRIDFELPNGGTNRSVEIRYADQLESVLRQGEVSIGRRGLPKIVGGHGGGSAESEGLQPSQNLPKPLTPRQIAAAQAKADRMVADRAAGKAMTPEQIEEAKTLLGRVFGATTPAEREAMAPWNRPEAPPSTPRETFPAARLRDRLEAMMQPDGGQQAGMGPGDTEPPRTLYHHSSAQAAASIERSGLRRGLDQTVEDAETRGGVYLTDSPTPTSPNDVVWAVDVNGLPIERDPFSQAGVDTRGEQWTVHYGDIEPARLRRVQPETMQQRIQRLARQPRVQDTETQQQTVRGMAAEQTRLESAPPEVPGFPLDESAGGQRGGADLPVATGETGDVPIGMIRVRPEHFQARDVAPGSSFDERRVQQLVEGWDRSRLDPIVVAPDPEGGYVVLSGHHRLEAARRVGEENLPVRVVDVNIETDAGMQRAQREAILANFSVAEQNVRERVRAFTTLQQDGMSVDEIAGPARMTADKVQRTIDVGNAGAGVVDRVTANPALQDIASEVGRFRRMHPGTSLEDAQGTFDALVHRGKGESLPSVTAVRKILDGLAPAFENRLLPGFEGAGFGGDSTPLYAAVREGAKLQDELLAASRKLEGELRVVRGLGERAGKDVSELTAVSQGELDEVTAKLANLEAEVLGRVRAQAASSQPAAPRGQLELGQAGPEPVAQAAPVQTGPGLFGDEPPARPPAAARAEALAAGPFNRVEVPPAQYGGIGSQPPRPPVDGGPPPFSDYGPQGQFPGLPPASDGVPDTLWGRIVELGNLPRTLMAAGDFSNKLRQEAMLAPRNPREWWRSLRVQLEALKSEEALAASDQVIKAHADYPLLRRSGLYLAPISNAAEGALREESYAGGRLAAKIPGLGRLVRSTERGFIGGLNTMRAEVFYKQVAAMRRAGVEMSEERLKALGAGINAFSGRGSMPRFLENHAATINAGFFAPRNFFGRLEANALVFNRDPEIRKFAAQNLAAFYGTGAAILALGAAVGLDVELDPRSSDFGKLQLPNGQRIDFWAGNAQIARVAAQMGASAIPGVDEAKSARTGDTYQQDWQATAGRFLRSKLAPVPALGTELATGADFRGEELRLDPRANVEQAIGLVTPLFLSDFYEALKAQGLVAGVVAGVGSAAGLGVGTYEAGPADAASQALFGKPYSRLTGPERGDLVRAHPEVTGALIEQQSKLAGPAGQAAEVRGATRAQQEASDQQLLEGKLTRQQWQQQRSDRALKQRGALEALYGPADTISEQKASADPLKRYLKAMADATDPATGAVDAGELEKIRSSWGPELNAAIDRSLGTNDTPLVRLYREAASKYYDLPRYKGYTGDEARSIDALWTLARAGAKSSEELDMSRALRAVLRDGEYDPAIVRGVRRRIAGKLPTAPDRKRMATRDPLAAFFFGSNALSPSQRAQVEARIGERTAAA